MAVTAVFLCSCAIPGSVEDSPSIPGCGNTSAPGLVFSAPSNGDGTSDVFGLVGDGELSQLTDDGSSFEPSFSADGRSIIFVRADGSVPAGGPSLTRSVWTMDAAGGHQERLADVTGAGGPRFSPNGQHIVLTEVQADGVPRISLMKSDGSGLRQVTPTAVDLPDGFVLIGELYPAWAPDGESLAFVRTRSQLDGFAQLELVLHDLTTGVERDIYSTTGYISGLSWAADGQSILFSDFETPDYTPERTRVALTVTIADGEVQQLAVNASSPSYITNDGQNLLFYTPTTEQSEGRVEVRTASLRTGETHTVTTLPFEPTSPLSLPQCAMTDTEAPTADPD